MISVSIIVPAYNVQDTLEYTLQDIKNQTYSNYELILVDDGSSDRTPAICDDAAAADDRIKVIHQANGGMSVARNVGTEAASGLYVTYVDADDRIEPYYLEYLVRAIEESGAKIAAGCICRAVEGYRISGEYTQYILRVLSCKRALGEMLSGRRMTISACGKLVLRDIMLKCTYPEGMYYEDLYNTWRVILEADKVACVDTVLYHYVMRGGSVTGRKNPTRIQCLDYYDAIRTCYRGVLGEYPGLKRDIAVQIARDCMSLYLSMGRCCESEPLFVSIRSSICRWMKKNSRLAVCNRRASLEVRLRILLYMVSPVLYERMYYIGIRLKRKRLL